MKQVVQPLRSKQPAVVDVPPPQCGAGELLVATRASLISAGTERMLMEFAGKSALGKAKERPDLAQKVFTKLQRDGLIATANSVLSQLSVPLPLGYSAAGEVIAVGSQLQNQYQTGDRVVLAGAGLANHAEINAVPKNLLAPLPADVPYEHGCFATVTAIAMQGVRNAQPALGDVVGVIGLGLVGQLAAQLLKANGCTVLGIDYDQGRCDLAAQEGIIAINPGSSDVASQVQQYSHGRGLDSILICAATDSNEPLKNAVAWARDKATVVMVGKVGTEVPYADFMKKELNLIISRSYGPGRYDPTFENKGISYPIGYVRWNERENLAAAAELMASGQLNIAPLISHQFAIEKAEAAYELLLNGKEPTLGVVLNYAENKAAEASKVQLSSAPRPLTEGNVGIGWIGAGAFTRSVLLPSLKKTGQVDLIGIASKGGASAAATGKNHGFDYATSEVKELLADNKINAVVIATRHNTHAELVQQALAAGKHVFVEKPLGMTLAEIAAVEKAMSKQPQQICMVGYNRRFSPQANALRQAFNGVSPVQINFRINAGQLPANNWQTDPSTGGGRLIGEMCHFTDLVLSLLPEQPTQLQAVTGKGQDVYGITLTCADGSIAQLFYTSEGNTTCSKERLEIYGGGMVGVLDNFQQCTLSKGGAAKPLGPQGSWLKGQDKGHYAQLEAFIAAVQGRQEAPISPAELIFSSSLTLLAQQAAQSGETIKL